MGTVLVCISINLTTVFPSVTNPVYYDVYCKNQNQRSRSSDVSLQFKFFKPTTQISLSIYISCRRRAPVCGIAAQAVRRQILMNQQHEPNVLGNNKKVYQTFGSTPQLANERHKEMYSQIRRGDDSSFRSRDRFVPPRRPRMGYGSSDLSAIEVMVS